MSRRDVDNMLAFDPFAAPDAATVARRADEDLNPSSAVTPAAYIGGLARAMQRDADDRAEQDRDRVAVRDWFDQFDRRLVVARLDALLAVRAAEAGLRLIEGVQ